ncbi:MAG: Gfo/Idh/MocA family oxidoreductase [Opitutaceae bacterium]|jgi:predicted dehydrogenase|nr:Gfo/Idh/MocA family oxidoreductase [Opitutaceae bacterium]
MSTKLTRQKHRKDTPVRVAVAGAGAIGVDHIANYRRHPAALVVALAETDPARARAAADQFGVPETVADWRALLARADIDALSIALPNHLHAPVALAALRAGKHVMLDKPMATAARDAARLVAAARARGLVLMVGQNNRFLPDVQTARRLIDNGALGDVYHAKTAWMRRAGIPRIGSWFTQKKYAGGGCAYDIGVHALDRCLYLLGEFDAAAVSGQTYARFGPRGEGDGSWGKSEIDPARPFDVDDLCVALIKLKSGRTVLLEASWAAHQPEPDCNVTQVFGTEAGLLLPPLKLFRQTKTGYATELVDAAAGAPGENRMAHFIDCVLGRADPFVKPEESLAVQKILDAIYASAASGREVRLK